MVHPSSMVIVVCKVDKVGFELQESKGQVPTDSPSLLESFGYWAQASYFRA